MSDFNNGYARPLPRTADMSVDAGLRAFMLGVYNKLALGLAGQGPGAIHGHVAHGHASGIGCLEEVDATQQGGLPGAGRAEEHDALGRLDPKGDVLEDGVAVEALAEVFNVDHGAWSVRASGPPAMPPSSSRGTGPPS